MGYWGKKLFQLPPTHTCPSITQLRWWPVPSHLGTRSTGWNSQGWDKSPYYIGWQHWGDKVIKTKVTVKADRGVESRSLGLKTLSAPSERTVETTHRLCLLVFQMWKLRSWDVNAPSPTTEACRSAGTQGQKEPRPLQLHSASHLRGASSKHPGFMDLLRSNEVRK